MGSAEEVPVLVVGGSMIGLTTAMLLARHGISSLAVERHPGTAIHPRAGHFQVRTLEILREAGLEDEIREVSARYYSPNGGINAVESLAGEEIANYIPNLNEGVEEFSPTVRVFLDQDVLEPILRRQAQELGAHVRYTTEAASFEQDDEGVTTVLRDLRSGEETTVRSRYLVAADGNRSSIRRRLGIEMRGYGVLSNSVTIYFRADVAPLLGDRDQGVIYVKNPQLRGFFRLDRSGGRGFLVVNTVGEDPTLPEATNVAADFDEHRALELVRIAVGTDEIPVEILDVARWQAISDVAERYGEGRVFLAGDAAHVVPPNGGYGGNVGVHDAHNLAWKLALALRGAAGPQLLPSYDAERRPIGQLTIEQAYARYVTRVVPEIGMDGVKPIVDDWSMEIGQLYHSPVIVSEPGDDGAVHQHPRDTRGRPGSRAPHVVIERDGARMSTLDLFGTRFVLLAGPQGGAWCDAARESGLDVEAYQVGRDLDDPDGRVPDAHGLSPSGAAIVRPDGVVGWRAAELHEAAPGDVLRAAASTLLGFGG